MTRKLLATLAAFAMALTGAIPVMGVARPEAPPPSAEVPVSMPASATDETAVPHYFGPYPNWANSPFTLPDATVTITGDGAGATAEAAVGANGAITGITVTNPGTGYTSATVDVTGAGTGATATATVTTSGMVTGITVDAAGGGYVEPVVTISGGGGQGTLTQVGNPLTERAYATDYEAATPVRVLVVVPVALPAGTLTEFLSLNQATAGGSPAPSAGNTFNAYVLRPTGTPNEYTVVFDSGTQTVPALADPAVSEVATFDVTDTAVQAGDVVAFYGAGIPVDTGTGADLFMYPSPAAPVQGGTITVGSADYPLYGQAREYSFAASVIDSSSVVPLSGATALAYGGVDAITLVDPGSGYTMPTIDFDYPDDPNGTQAKAHAEYDQATGVITGIVVDEPGSGYATAPNVVIRNGTLHDPITPLDPATFTTATATSTLKILSVAVEDFGSGYATAPSVTISDAAGDGTGASATAAINAGGVTAIDLTAAGSGYVSEGGIRKFVDELPGLGAAGANNLGQYLPVAVPDTETFPGADYYVIAVVQHREQMHSDLPPTLLREYVQLDTDKIPGGGVPLQTAVLGGTTVPTLMPDGSQAMGVDKPHYLGPVILAQKDRPVRITFYNLLPTGVGGDLFLPVDSTMMGSGMGPLDPMPEAMDEASVTDMVRNPMCTDARGMGDVCFTKNRATLHLHGGITPWISDGTPHQWITPAGEMASWPEGVSVEPVPDMVTPEAQAAGVPDCSAADDGCMTFYYTNQQSARFMFYHDHAWGITRLNVYAGEAAGYMIQDATEQKLIEDGLLPADQIPLVIQDRTFVPDDDQLAWQDPTWDPERWGGYGNLWYHHVYMPAQNPGDPSGMSAFGRWMYSPWFWPPAEMTKHGPIANPYYNMDPATNFTTPLPQPCNIDDPATWQYQEEPFCEPQEIPGTPNVSAGMEQFNDTPVVNGTAYPTLTVDPKAYRLRVLNAANDRFWNLQWYVGDASTASTGLNGAGDTIGATEVALKAAEVEAALTDPAGVFPTPDLARSPAGPEWIQIGTEGGFLPAPVVVDGQQVTTWITDPTRFDVGNVDQHSLLLAPAERADAVVDFSRFAGKTLILYNDAPAAFPARIPSYDYYTGAPDLRPVGAPSILPGYGPNTRTIMQVKVANLTPAPAFDQAGTLNDGLGRLAAAFRHKADGSGVFESGQHPIVVGQAAYNSAYGTSFASSGWCNSPTNPTTRCDGYARISEQGGELFGFNTLKNPTTKTEVRIEPKAIQDETSETSFDEYGRMTAVLGLEQVPASPGLQNAILYPYTGPTTEVIDSTNLPKLTPGDTEVTPISVGTDGTQIWKITHNGVDTHPIHFHLFDVQLINRVTWDNIIKPPDATELGWKDTIRVAPLEDTLVALRPVIPWVPFDLPNSVRLLSPMMPDGMMLASATAAELLGQPIISFAPNGEPIDIVNHYVNFGAEYVYHCHILSHEEMDMMRPVSVAIQPRDPTGLTVSAPTGTGADRRVDLSWTDASMNETAWEVQRKRGEGEWETAATIPTEAELGPDTGETTGGSVTWSDVIAGTDASVHSYRVRAINVVGDTWDYADPNLNEIVAGGFPTTTTVSAWSAEATVLITPDDPTALAATFQAATNGPGWLNPRVQLAWTDAANNETGYVVERSVGAGAFTQLGGTLPASTTSLTDVPVDGGTTYAYRVYAVNTSGSSGFSNEASVTTPSFPASPTDVAVTCTQQGRNNARCAMTWTDVAANTAYTVQRATNEAFTTGVTTVTNIGADATTWAPNTNLNRDRDYWFRIRATNGSGASAWTNAAPFPVHTP